MNYCYYVVKNLDKIKSTKVSEIGDLSPGVRIIAVPTTFPIIVDSKDLEGPFIDIKSIIKYSNVYKNLKISNSRRADKIIREEYINKVSDFMLSPKGQTYSYDLMKSFVHSVFGTFQNDYVTGIHFYDESKVKIIELLDVNEKGIWKARIEAFDIRTQKWKEKIKPTIFFPKDWNKTRLLEEISYAKQNIKLKHGSEKCFESKTKSGIDVVFIIENGKIKTIYPII